MPIKPAAKTHYCPICKWQQLDSPQSDALIVAAPESCPNCGSKELHAHAATPIDNIISVIHHLFRQ